MSESKVALKIIHYLLLKSGKEISRTELVDKFVGQIKPPKKKKKKANKFKKDKVGNITEFVFNFINALEDEELLVKTHKKMLKVAKPFRIQGKMSLSKRGDGFVKLQSGSEVFIPAAQTGDSIQGDIVEIIPLGLGKKNRLEGEVTAIIKRGRNLYRFKVIENGTTYISGKLLDMTGEEKIAIIHKRTLLTDIINAIKINEVLIVKLKEDTHHERDVYEVTFIKFESEVGADIDFNRILMKYDYHPVYSDTVTINLSDIVDETTVHDWKDRVDLRDLYTITIDGATAKDFDDAISYLEENGIFRFYVHIADVSHYVKPYSALDEEAQKRATSVYLSNKVVPMLPPELSEHLCSLVANVNRLAFTVEMDADASGNIISAKYYKSVIKVNQRYTYDMAEKELNDNYPGNWLCKVMRLVDKLKAKRIEMGRVELNLKETEIITDKDGKIIELKLRDRLKSHILIEELMLSANTKVAEFIRKKKVPTLYRIHEPMDDKKLEVLNAFLELYGFKYAIKDSKYDELKKVLVHVKDSKAEKLFNYFLLRSFMQAYYGGEQKGHWGLGFQDYCHFTSPIRRYPDLVCHRVLDSILKSDEAPYKERDIFTLGIHCSDEERKAQDAERDILKLKACRYIADKGITKFKGVITGIKGQMIYVELEDLNVEGTVTKEHFTDEYELLMPDDFSFVDKKRSKVYYLGTLLELELDRVDFEEIRIFVKPL